jgi:hypothetical protein
MTRGLSLFAIGLVFGGGIGFAIAAGNGITFDGHDHGEASVQGEAVDHAAMGHGAAGHAAMHDTPLEVSEVDAPAVAAEIFRDPQSGYNLQVQTRNFVFAPRSASLDPVPGEGHAHVYVNGEKLGRLYGEWMHIAVLPQGEVTVEVTLNSNDHRPLAIGGEMVSASVALNVE